MKLETIKEAVDKKFNLDISLNTRQRNYSYAKKVFSKLAYESGATFREVGDVIKKSHCNILHHVNSIDVITLEDKRKHDQIIRELGLVLSKPFFNPEQEKIKKEVKKKTTNKKQPNTLEWKELLSSVKEFYNIFEKNNKFKIVLDLSLLGYLTPLQYFEILRIFFTKKNKEINK